MHKKEDASPFPVTETSLRRYIDSLDLYKDRSRFANIKPAMIFVQKVRNDPEISFTSNDLIIEGLLREVGARFKKEFSLVSPEASKTSAVSIRSFQALSQNRRD